MAIEAEETIKEENIDLVALANAGDNDGDKGGEEELPQLSDTEQKAFDQGWRPQEDFEGPEDNWKTAREYVRDGEFLATIKGLNQRMDDQKKDFDSRLENTNKLHDARRKKDIADLETEMLDAVRTSDTEAYKDAKGKKTELEKEENTTTTATNEPATNERPVVDDWLAKNKWINDKSDKADFANDTWNGYVQRNPDSSDDEAIAHVNAQLTKFYPVNNNNPRRDQQNSNETIAKRGKKSGKTLTMGDLTQDEKNEYTQFGSMFKNETDFLKAVKDTRAAS